MSGSITNPNEFASLPNSRIRPRKATDEAFTFQMYAQDPDGGDYTDDQFDTAPTPSEATALAADRGKTTIIGNTILIEKNSTRTYITLRNLDSENSIVYGYDDVAALDLATLPVVGSTAEGAGMVLKAGDSVDLEVPNVVYVRSHAPAGEKVLVAVDYGIG